MEMHEESQGYTSDGEVSGATAAQNTSMFGGFGAGQPAATDDVPSAFEQHEAIEDDDDRFEDLVPTRIRVAITGRRHRTLRGERRFRFRRDDEDDDPPPTPAVIRPRPLPTLDTAASLQAA